MAKKLTPCKHCGIGQREPALLCWRCDRKEDIRHKYGLLLSSDIDLKSLTVKERMIAFIYCATGDADYFEHIVRRGINIPEPDMFEMHRRIDRNVRPER